MVPFRVFISSPQAEFAKEREQLYLYEQNEKHLNEI
jgi:hypothetical protein